MEQAGQETHAHRLQPLLRPQEAAEFLGISTKTLRRIGVKRVAYSDRTMRYRIADLEDAKARRAHLMAQHPERYLRSGGTRDALGE